MFTKIFKTDRNHGTTLLETIISTAIFSLLALALFLFYSMGKLKWNVMILRHELQGEARKSMLSLERDLRKTNYNSIDVYSNPRVTPPGWTIDVPRWAICMVGIDDWSNPANFNASTGRPIWNQYVIYMATTEINQGGIGPTNAAGSGRFYRFVVSYSGAASATNPLPLHFPAFVPTVDWVNNEFALSGVKKVGLMRTDRQRKLLLSALPFPFITEPQYRVGDWVAIGVSPTETQTPLDPATESQPAPTQPANPAGDKGNTDAAAGAPTDQIETDLKGVIQGTAPPAVFQAPAVRVTLLGSNVFAFRVNKDDVHKVVEVSYKTRGYVQRTGQMSTGYESRQIDINVAPLAFKPVQHRVALVRHASDVNHANHE